MNNISFDIKTANEHDASDIARINVICWQKAYSDIFPEQILNSLSIDRWTEGWKFQLQNNAIVLVISLKDKIVGFSRICKNQISSDSSEEGEINAIYIHPDHWEQGLGKELCLASFEKLKNLGFKKAILWVLSDNLRARRFYESLGLEKSDLSRVWSKLSELNLDEIQYEKILL